MSDTTTDLWGQDIALDGSGQARVAANGELVLTDGVDTGVQDIRLRMFTRLGKLFYDRQFGSLIHDWILEESTAADARSITALARWRFLEDDTPMSLVLQINKLTMELVVKDADPRTDSFVQAVAVS